MINVDRVRPSLGVRLQDNAQRASGDDDLQAFIDNSDLIISNQDTAVFNKILANSTDTILYL